MSTNLPYTEKELLLRIADGDEDAFKALFSLYIPFLQPTIKKLVKDAAVADDILQEVFMRIWLYRDKLAFVESPRSWVLKVVYNRVFTYKGNEEKYQAGIVGASEGRNDISVETEDRLAYRNLRHLLAEAVEQLPPRQRSIYQLSRVDGMSPQQIAKHLGLSVQTVKNTLGAALQSIRTYIIAAGYTLSLFILFSIFF